MYLNGLGVAKDEKEAVRWYRKAADQGEDTAQAYLGWMCTKAGAWSWTTRKPLRWYRKAVEQGNAVAKYNLGKMYDNGRGVEKDDKVRATSGALGDPTEAALLTLAAKAGVFRDQVTSSHRIVQELPFDSERKRMTVIALDERGREVLHSKGSADVLLPLAPCTKPRPGACRSTRSHEPLDRQAEP